MDCNRKLQELVKWGLQVNGQCRCIECSLNLRNLLRLEGMVWMGLEGMSRHIGAT
ncbi:hypothetical protein HanPSC8_Chr11g0456861 [Helianthus annuus]|nr:hypothetical protein HanPSC8_Chr11g0456861 [Helianthus annuus]